MNPFDLTGRSALVTGSTRGIGAAIASGLENAGAEVIRHGFPLPAQASAQPSILSCDLIEDGAPERLLEEAFALQPSLDLLICNAGSFFDVPFLEMEESRFAKTMRLNVEQAYFLIQDFARRLIAQSRHGAVVIISSTNGVQAEEDSSAYDTSKGALIMMTRSLGLALASKNIRVNGVAPGLIRTPLTEHWMAARPDRVLHYEKKIPAGRIGRPEDCVGASVFLCSDAAQYIIGQTLIIDGGLTSTQIGRL